MEYYSEKKRNEIVTCMKIMALEIIMLSKINQTQKDRVCTLLSHMWIVELKSNKKKRMYKGDYWEGTSRREKGNEKVIE
jgi:hypothetical protein